MKSYLRKAILILLLGVVVMGAFGGCSDGQSIKLNPKDPVTISVWHYYNGAVMNAFDLLIREFNDTVGVEQGIIIEAYSYGGISDLQTAVLDAANGIVGSSEMPNIFASYSDLAFTIDQMGFLANLDDYVTAAERATYIESYWEEGILGEANTHRIFPIAKSTEVLILNETDWSVFATECGYTHDDLATMEGVVRTAQAYHEWTDAKTPDVPNDGQALWGRDSISNMMLIGCKQLGVELFAVEQGVVTINADKAAIRRIWDMYYVPSIYGWFSASGNFRSESARVGEILGYVGSTASAAYFPSVVTKNEKDYPISAVVLPTPILEGGENVIVQQGAGMVVKKATKEEEYASVVFLKWATEKTPNILFAARSGYLPVKKDANDYESFMSTVSEADIETTPIAAQTHETAFRMIQNGEAYTNKAFDGATTARKVLDTAISSSVAADREAVVSRLAEGQTLAEATAAFVTDAYFDEWYAAFTAVLYAAVGQ